MAGLLKRNAAVLFKKEVTYGTDPTPSGAANAVLVSDLTMRPMDMKTVDRALIRPFLGSSEQLPGEIYNGCSFSVELAGSGAAGTAPAWGPLMECCGFAESVVADTSVTYAPISSAFPSGTFYVNLDGVLHKGVGARGTWKASLKNNDIPRLQFDFTGLFVPVTDAATPAVDFSAFQKPLVLSRTNTPTFTLHGYAATLSSLDIDLGNTVQYRGLIGGNEYVLLTDRAVKGSVSMEAVKVADKDWWASIQAAETAPLHLVHGLEAGNIVTLDSPAVQVHTPTYADDQGILMLNASLAMPPSATGNDELTITLS